MRLLSCLIILTSLQGIAAGWAQGVKDPANHSAAAASRSNTATESSRPTTVRNVPTNSMPTGVAVQRVYKDGKLYNIGR